MELDEANEEEEQEKYSFLDPALAKKERQISLDNSRMLSLELTDGRNKYQAIEYRQVPCFLTL